MLLAISVAEQHLDIPAPALLAAEAAEVELEAVMMEHLASLYLRFSDQSPQPASRSRRAAPRRTEDAGLGDSLSSSFSSSETSLTSSLLSPACPAPAPAPGTDGHSQPPPSHQPPPDPQQPQQQEERQMSPESPEKPPRLLLSHGRSHESLLAPGPASLQRPDRRQSEAFTAALRKFSSLSSAHISIKLPSFSLPSKPPPAQRPETRDEVTSCSRAEARETKETISTQTECLEVHGLQRLAASCGEASDPWRSCYSPQSYYSTQLSPCYQMYSTLV